MKSSQTHEDPMEQRRRHFRVAVTISLRLRPAADGDAASRDSVSAYEELVSAASRYRKELEGPGRAFVDRLMAMLDALTGELAGRDREGGWSESRAVAANLSAGGLGFHWGEGQARGSVLDLEFAIADAESTVPFRLRGVVVRSEPAGGGGFEVGVEFSATPAPTQQRLVRLLLEMQRVDLRSRAGER